MELDVEFEGYRFPWNSAFTCWENTETINIYVFPSERGDCIWFVCALQINELRIIRRDTDEAAMTEAFRAAVKIMHQVFQ